MLEKREPISVLLSTTRHHAVMLSHHAGPGQGQEKRSPFDRLHRSSVPAWWERRMGMLALGLGSSSSPMQVLQPPQGHRVWKAQPILQISISAVFFEEKGCFPLWLLLPAEITSGSGRSKTATRKGIFTCLVPPQRDKLGAPLAPANCRAFPSMI